jgi:hypothetical protein
MVEGVDAKIARAQEHVDALHSEAGVFFQRTKKNFVLKSNEQEAWIVHWIDNPFPPIRLGVLLGECVFNMRSALDNLVCGLVRTKDPRAECKGTQFPICVTQKCWNDHWRKYLKGVEPEAQRDDQGSTAMFPEFVGAGQRPIERLERPLQ